MLSPEYLQAIGDVIARWAYFEVEFDECLIGFLLQHPEAQKLPKTTPTQFKKRLKLFRDAVKVGFKNHPSALGRFLSITGRAGQLRKDRDHVAHGRWFTDTEDRIGLYLVRFGNWERAEAKLWPLEKIKKTAHEIGCLRAELMILLRAGLPKNADWFLTSEEISAIQEFRRNNLPTPPPSPA